MSNSLASATVAFAITTAFLLALRPLAIASGLIDRPGGRKSHIGDVPILGGIAMFIGIFAGFTVIYAVSVAMVSLLVASFLLVMIGALDDRYGVSATVRIATQIAVVLIMVFGAGLYLRDIGNPLGIGVISLGPLAVLFTMVVSLTMINGYNLIDGADGLAGSLALIALLAISVVGGPGYPSTAAALTMAAAVTGFLLFNFPVPWNRPVRTFMGDAGSTLLGFSIVWITLTISQGPDRLISPVYCLWFASIPIYDLFTCFVRRAAAGRSPFRPGRDHFHHSLNRGGLTVRQTVAVLTGLQLIYASIGLAGYYLQIPEAAMFAAWSTLGLTQRFVIRKIAKFHRLFLRMRVLARSAAASAGTRPIRAESRMRTGVRRKSR